NSFASAASRGLSKPSSGSLIDRDPVALNVILELTPTNTMIITLNAASVVFVIGLSFRRCLTTALFGRPVRRLPGCILAKCRSRESSELSEILQLSAAHCKKTALGILAETERVLGPRSALDWQRQDLERSTRATDTAPTALPDSSPIRLPRANSLRAHLLR